MTCSIRIALAALVAPLPTLCVVSLLALLPCACDGSPPAADAAAAIDGSVRVDGAIGMDASRESDGSLGGRDGSLDVDAAAGDARAAGACAAAAAAAGWDLCAEDASSCSLVFSDGTGCVAACARAGLVCVESFENAAGACGPDESLPALGCAETGHGSDYCACGSSAPDAGAPGDGGTIATGPVGFASVPGYGVSRTTGGAGGRTVTARTASELASYAGSSEALVIEVVGTIVIPSLRIASNKTIVGVGPDAVLRGGLRVEGESTTDMVSNVILQNLTIDALESTEPDAVGIRYAHHVWIDHCDIRDARDGLVDITLASDHVTVSWTRFSYPLQPPEIHRLAMLIGAADDAFEDRGRLRVTLHHNHWGERVVERMPRVRFGQVHVFGNHFVSRDAGRCVGAAVESSVLVENNCFDDVKDPHEFIYDPPTAELAARGNQYLGRSATTRRDTRGDAFVPPYPYALDRAEDVRALVAGGAGPR